MTPPARRGRPSAPRWFGGGQARLGIDVLFTAERLGLRAGAGLTRLLAGQETSCQLRPPGHDGTAMTGPAKTGRHGLVRRVYTVVRFPPPVDDPLFSSRAQAASYLGAWGLTATHLVLWLLIAIGLLTSEALVIGVSLLSFAATCLLIGMVIAAHRRLQLYHGSTTRHLATVWWRGPWDPVGRLIWLPVRLPAAWHILRHRTSPPAQTGPSRLRPTARASRAYLALRGCQVSGVTDVVGVTCVPRSGGRRR